MVVEALMPPDAARVAIRIATRVATRVATVYTNAPKRIREAISIDLCTLLRRRPGGDAHAALAVTQPPTHTNSRSLLYLNSCARIYGKGVSVGGREADRPDWPFLPDGYSLGKAYAE